MLSFSQKPPVTLLNVSKCSVLQIKEELEARNVYDETDAVAWKAFKDTATKFWLESYQTSKSVGGGARSQQCHGGRAVDRNGGKRESGQTADTRGRVDVPRHRRVVHVRTAPKDDRIQHDGGPQGGRHQSLQTVRRVALEARTETSEDFVSDRVVEKGATKRTKNSETVEKMLAAVTVDSRVKVDPKDATDFL
jgi:hypothetical protein